jgi:hypothetical protein
MYKDSKKNFVGQPIFKQLINLLPKNKFAALVKKHNTDYYYKTLYSWQQLVSMLYGIFQRCDSTSEICGGMEHLEGKLNYFGFDASPAKSTFGDAMRNRNCDLFKYFYFSLLKHFADVLSVSRIENISFDKFYAFDSTTITLFSQVMKGIGRNRKDDGKKKGGLKVHMLTDIHSDCAKFVHISEASRHDKTFLSYLTLPEGSMVVCDKAYNHYLQFAKWTQQGVFFVTKMKKNAVYEVQNEIFSSDTDFGITKVEHIHLSYKEDKKNKTLCLRKVNYIDPKGKNLVFITNNWDITAEEVALLYKNRWSIEMVFKKLKQNFQLHFFWTDNENGIKSQVYVTLIAYLLLSVLKRRTASKKAFSTIATLVRMFLSEHKDLYWLITSGQRTYSKKTRNKSPTKEIQLELF